MGNKVMRYIRSDNGNLQLHICESGIWKHYRRVRFVQPETPHLTPGYRTFQYYLLKLGYEFLPTISIEAFGQMTKFEGDRIVQVNRFDAPI